MLGLRFSMLGMKADEEPTSLFDEEGNPTILKIEALDTLAAAARSVQRDLPAGAGEATANVTRSYKVVFNAIAKKKDFLEKKSPNSSPEKEGEEKEKGWKGAKGAKGGRRARRRATGGKGRERRERERKEGKGKGERRKGGEERGERRKEGEEKGGKGREKMTTPKRKG